jgi:hypothetical protein
MKEDIESAFERFNNAYENTKLIDEPDEQEFRNYLYTIRISDINKR